MPAATLPTILAWCACLSWLPLACQAVEIRLGEHEGRQQFVVTTEAAVYYYDCNGGGFSRLIDRDGRDWIGFQKSPLSTYPDSAAAGYRGMPNCVFVGPDKGAGHPGFDQCESEIVDQHTIRTRSRSGKWQWSWQFTEATATFAMEQAGAQPWWFLYEGPIAGTFEPQQKLWGTDQHGLRQDQPAGDSKVFGRWQRLYVADRRVPRVLFIEQAKTDDLPDTLWYLGSSNAGAANSPDGMVVVGFGRGPNTKPQFMGAGQSFTIGLVEMPGALASASKPESASENWSAERIDQAIDAAIGGSRVNEPVDPSTTTEPKAAEDRATGAESTRENQKRISIWYGHEQVFGTLGMAQVQCNVLGSVSSAGSLESLTYRLDGGMLQPLSVGSDLHRLGRSGDFNIELFHDNLSAGQHALDILAKWDDATTAQETVALEVAKPKSAWPLPYDLNLEEMAGQPSWTTVQRAAQIVDGKWAWTTTGLRTAEPWYDRVLAVGDQSWTDYTARVWLTLHDFTPPQSGPPTFGVSHCGLALRWRGHTADGRQPSRKWYPMGCQGELLLRTSLDQCQWRALPGNATGSKPIYAARKTPVARQVRLVLKAAVETGGDGQHHYRFKHWIQGEPEPIDWFVENVEAALSDHASGSFLVVPHNSDVTIHRILVEPLDGTKPEFGR